MYLQQIKNPPNAGFLLPRNSYLLKLCVAAQSQGKLAQAR